MVQNIWLNAYLWTQKWYCCEEPFKHPSSCIYRHRFQIQTLSLILSAFLECFSFTWIAKSSREHWCQISLLFSLMREEKLESDSHESCVRVCGCACVNEYMRAWVCGNSQGMCNFKTNRLFPHSPCCRVQSVWLIRKQLCHLMASPYDSTCYYGNTQNLNQRL